nr:hypothetical protein [uncultured Mediterranean phage uvMED]
MGIFSKKQTEFKTHSFDSKMDFIKEMRSAKKNMSKKQFKTYENRLKENLFLGQSIARARARGDKVEINYNSPKFKKFSIG